MKKLLLFSVLLLSLQCLSANLSAQGNGPSPHLIAFEIAVADVYEMTPTIGFTNQPAQQYKRYQQLVRTAKPEELIGIINAHGNPVVRLYAYQALLAQKAVIPEDIVQKMKNDKSKVIAMQGCVRFDGFVSGLADKSLETSGAITRVQTPTFF